MNKNDFSYNYVAPTSKERKEIESIRNNYLPSSEKADNKLVRLRKLDGKVKNVPTAYSLALGVFGLLTFGLGFAMILEWGLLAWGIVICVISFLPMLIAYPVYVKYTKVLKNKYSKEILKLSEELLNDEK